MIFNGNETKTIGVDLSESVGASRTGFVPKPVVVWDPAVLD